MQQKTEQKRQEPDWSLVLDCPDWFGDGEKKLRRLCDEKAAKFADDAIESLAASKTGHPIPNSEDLSRASNDINCNIADIVRSEEFLKLLQINGTEATNIRLALDKLLPKMELPAPPVTKTEIKPVAAGLFAVFGAIIGMLLCAGICRLALGTATEGILVGASLGAFLFTWGLIHVAKSETLQKWITVTLGFLTLAEVATQVGRLWFPPLSWLSNKAGGNSGFFKRMLAYVALYILIQTTRCKDEFDADQYRNALHARIRQQLDFALAIIAVLGQIVFKASEIKSDTISVADAGTKKTLVKIAEIVREFNRAADLQEIGDLLDVLVQELRNAGYELGKPNPKLFEKSDNEQKPANVSRPNVVCWTEDMREKYETFGLVEAGDSVAIMTEPLVQNGVVTQKGQVKKSKRGAT